jgi:hypothetical protein
MELAPHLYIEPRLRLRGAPPPLPDKSPLLTYLLVTELSPS